MGGFAAWSAAAPAPLDCAPFAAAPPEWTDGPIALLHAAEDYAWPAAFVLVALVMLWTLATRRRQLLDRLAPVAVRGGLSVLAGFVLGGLVERALPSHWQIAPVFSVILAALGALAGIYWLERMVSAATAPRGARAP